MKAGLLYSQTRSLKIESIPTPTPAPFQVLVKVKACGVCGSDLHLILHGKLKAKHYPCVPGHEASGVIHSIGDSCTKFKVGDRVVIAAGTSCGTCEHCLNGKENLCNEIGVLGFNQNGAYAEFIAIEERYLHKLPDSIPFSEGAILADAVSTPYFALKNIGELKPGEDVCIIGCGGLGIHGVVLAKALGANKIIAVDIDAGSLENASFYGATHLIHLTSQQNLGKILKEGNLEVDLLADFTGVMENIENGLRAVRRGGRIVLVGIGRKPLSISMPFFMIERQISIRGSYGSDRSAIPDLIQLYESGKISLKKSITSIHPLEEVNDCLHNLESKKNNPIRFIINPEL